jgi:2-iminobutanoate/2-iminopropanoate deaminase
LIFTAGQIPLDPVSGQIVGGNVADQTERVLQNLSAILSSSGSSLDKVVKTTVFLKNISDFADMNSVYGRYFTANPPARSTVEVSRLPKDVLVEIECLALVD